MDVEQRARELLAEQIFNAYPDSTGKTLVITQLLADELDLISARVAVKTLVAALTPPEGYVLAPVEPTDDMLNSGLFGLEPMLHVSDIRAIYDDMLSARPEVP